jgi:DNA-binding CsgD family transcriptional regulator
MTLTPRQKEVLRLVAMGHTAEEIGSALGISARTARAHTDALRSKLGVSRRRQIPMAYRRVTGKDPLLPTSAEHG